MLTVEQAANELEISAALVRAHARGDRKPTLPLASIGRTMLFREADVRAFAELVRRVRVLEAMGDGARAGELVREWESAITA